MAPATATAPANLTRTCTSHLLRLVDPLGTHDACGATFVPVPPRLFFDLGSPYAYLAVERASAVLGPDTELAPLFLGPIFRLRGFGSWAHTDARDANVAEVERRAGGGWAPAHDLAARLAAEHAAGDAGGPVGDPPRPRGRLRPRGLPPRVRPRRRPGRR